jgi:hypothetical protein
MLALAVAVSAGAAWAIPPDPLFTTEQIAGPLTTAPAPFCAASGDVTGSFSAGADGLPELATAGFDLDNPVMFEPVVVQVARNMSSPGSIAWLPWAQLNITSDLMLALGVPPDDAFPPVLQIEFAEVTGDTLTDLVVLVNYRIGATPRSAILVYRYIDAIDSYVLVNTVPTSDRRLSGIAIADFTGDGQLDIVGAVDSLENPPSSSNDRVYRFQNTFQNGSYGHFVALTPLEYSTAPGTENPTNLIAATDLVAFSAISQQGGPADGPHVVTADIADGNESSITASDSIGGFVLVPELQGMLLRDNPAGGRMLVGQLRAGNLDKSILLWGGGTQVDAMHFRYKTGAVIGTSSYSVSVPCTAGGRDLIARDAALGRLNDDLLDDIAIVHAEGTPGCDAVLLLLGAGNYTMTGQNAVGQQYMLPLQSLSGISQTRNRLVIDDFDGDGSEDIGVLRREQGASSWHFSFFRNLN